MKMFLRSLSALAIALVVMNANATATNSCETSERESIRNEILKLAQDNTLNEAGFAETRLQLEELITELQNVSPTVDEERVLKFSPGSWKQVWSDEANNDQVGGPQRKLNQIYQFVSTSGWAFNFGIRELPNKALVTFALKVKASVRDNVQTTEITEAYLKMSPLLTGESLAATATTIYENPGATGPTDFVRRNVGNFPNGPIGAKGDFTLLYVDDVLKIGKAANVFTGKVELYVLLRQDSID